MRRRPVVVAVGLLAVGALAAASVPAGASPRPRVSAAAADRGGFPGAPDGVGDADRRGPALAPLASARAAVAALGATAQYNRFGTVSSMSRPSGWLATRLPGGDAVGVARAFLRANSTLVGLTPAEVDALPVASDTPFTPSPQARVVAFQQSAGGFPLTEGGRIVVGVRGDSVGSLSSAAVPSAVLGRLARPATLLPAAQAVAAAAKDAGMSRITPSSLSATSASSPEWTVLRAAGVAQRQVARLRALPTTDRGVRLVWEVAVQDVAGAQVKAVQSYVDASSGAVLLRRDAVRSAAAGQTALPSAVTLPGAQTPPPPPQGGVYQGAFDPPKCAPDIPITVPAGTLTIVATAAAVVTTNDIYVDIIRNGTLLAHGDSGTSPEAATAQLTAPTTAQDAFVVRVCPFASPMVPFTPPYTFAGNYVTSAQGISTPPLPFNLVNQPELQGPGLYRLFAASPAIPPDPGADAQRANFCDAPAGTAAKGTGMSALPCDLLSFRDAAGFSDTSPSKLPYDVEPLSGLPSLSTTGNNAVTTNAQGSTSLTPGPPATPFASPSRTYAPAFTDAWRASRCDPVQTVAGADVDASIVNLFGGHNRTHDFSYLLGLTPERGAMQVSNYGVNSTDPNVREGDPEIGNAQNAAATNPVVSKSGALTGRNNANQITLMDGVPGITNQYLFEPVLGFYAPCTDGGQDASIWLHEYTHAISNRLIAGPGTGLSGQQGGSMGESWSDLVAIEFLQATDAAGKRGEDMYAEGAYATGNPVKGIRDYNLRPDRNPLTYGEFGFDSTGPEVHADGEIWNGIQMAVRQALIAAWDAKGRQFSDKVLQQSCAVGRTADGKPSPTFEGCPGNRRWVNYLFAGMYLQAAGDPTFLDIGNNMLQAATLANSPEDRAVMADAFAARGLGRNAASPAVGGAAASENTDPVPGFASETGRNATVTFDLVDAATGAKVPGEVYVGNYSARATPVATTLGGDKPVPVAQFVAGTYSFVVRAAGYGLQRFTGTFGSKPTLTQTFRLDRNVASAASGAKVSGDGGVGLENVIDDDEGTNGGFDGSAASTPVAGRTITVTLDGFKKVDRIAVSALHHPGPASPTDLPLLRANDPTFQGRLLGVRAFDVQASVDGGATWSTVYSSPDDFFPASRPRPVAPDINLRTVTLPTPVTANALRLVVRSNQCTGGPDFNGQQKSAAAVALNGDSACAYKTGVPAAQGGTTSLVAARAAAPDTGNAQAFQVLVSDFQAFGVPTSDPKLAQDPSKDGGTGTGTGTGTASRAGSTRGRALAATGASTALGGLALLLMAGAGVALRRRRADG